MTPQNMSMFSATTHLVIKGIPKSIEKRLRRISSNKKEFNKTKDVYQKALEDSDYTHTLK